MTWVAYRQQRVQLLASLVLIGVVAAVLVYFRFDALGYLREHGIEGCERVDDGRCGSAAMSAFVSEYHAYASSAIPLVLLCLPVLLGMFAGAPLFAREFERGTQVFALTQSVGRLRWWLTKLVVAGLPVVLAMILLGLVNVWAMEPLRAVVHGRMTTPGLEIQGLVLAGYTALAFALGVTASLVSKNTVVAMAATIGVYLVLLVSVANVARPHYQSPVERRGTVADAAVIGSRSGRGLVPDDAWWVGSRYFDATGAAVTFDPSSCREADGTIEPCLRRQGVAVVSAQYHPDSHFWPFQLMESGLVLLLGAILIGVSGWVVITRLS